MNKELVLRVFKVSGVELDGGYTANSFDVNINAEGKVTSIGSVTFFSDGGATDPFSGSYYRNSQEKARLSAGNVPEDVNINDLIKQLVTKLEEGLAE